MKKNIDDNEVKQMYEKIKTPEYNIKENVMNEINNHNKVRHINRKALIAAAILTTLLLVGTVGAATIFDDFKVFNFPYDNSGADITEENIMPEVTPLPDNIVISNAEEDKITSEFTRAAQPGELRIAYYTYPDGSGGGTYQPPVMEFDNYAVFEQYIKEANVYLPLPAYIPKDYSLDLCRITFWNDLALLQAEPASTEIIGGVNCLVFALPEGYEKNISGYTLRYANTNGNYIEIDSYLTTRFSENVSSGFGASAEATAENVSIEGFGDAMLINDKEKTYNYVNELVLYKEIEPVESAMILEKYMEEDLQGDIEFPPSAYMEIMDAMIIIISGDDVSRKDIIKIGENLK